MNELMVFGSKLKIKDEEKRVLIAVKAPVDIIDIVSNTLYIELSLWDIQESWHRVNDPFEIEMAMMEPENLFYRRTTDRALYTNLKTNKTYKLGIVEVDNKEIK